MVLIKHLISILLASSQSFSTEFISITIKTSAKLTLKLDPEFQCVSLFATTIAHFLQMLSLSKSFLHRILGAQKAVKRVLNCISGEFYKY